MKARYLLVAIVLTFALAISCGGGGGGGGSGDPVATPTPPPPPPASPHWAEIPTGSASSGGISDSTGQATGASLATDSSGNPYLAFADDFSGNEEIYVKRWDGSAWVDVGTGSISNNLGRSYAPSISINILNNPVVAWHDDSSGNLEVYVKQWDGSSWVEIGAGSATGGGISNNLGQSEWPKIATHFSDFPVVVWYDTSNGGYEIYVRRWNSSAWVEMGAGSATGGGISNNAGASKYPSLALDTLYYPVVAWGDNTSGNGEIYVKRWNGSSWIEVGAGSSSGGGISNTTGLSEWPSLKLDSFNNPVVAWDDHTPATSEIYIKRWDGASWVDIGTGSSSAGGISNNSGDSSLVSISLDSYDKPICAWGDYSNSAFGDIYVKKWNGSSWTELAESATAGGISNSSGESVWPTLVLDNSGNPIVAWQDDTSGQFEIYAKKYVP